jgi:peptidyl-prolyl cis-trans isomerase B (cyclophilin B)
MWFFFIENIYRKKGKKEIEMSKFLVLIAVCLLAFVGAAGAQEKSTETKVKEPAPRTIKKANQRPIVGASKTAAADPFDKADAKTMAAQCVKFETEAGGIEMEMFPESAPESVRSFLNLAAAGAFDTTTFSRVVPNFVIQGGDLFTSQKMTPILDRRARRTLPDEPSQIKHERGIVSMARSDEPNSTSTHFFILLSEARTLDGKFAAFGRVTKGMEVVETINKMPVEGEKPTKPVRITRATVALCPAQATTQE